MHEPSMTCPTDSHLLLNPPHHDMTTVKIVSREPFSLDRDCSVTR